ncbi:hypothetical protein [Marinobacter sp.]|uniref:hypothetical protein n=1 Tax=Marinobacter sp. TaxID=50741 RepID=UPI0035659335
MSFDPDFDRQQLDRLASQYLQGTTVSGKVIFFSDEDNRLSHATWRFDDADHATLRELGLKFALMDVLDNLIAYRVREGQPNAGQGVVSISDSMMTLRWTSLEVAEALRDKD